ARSSVLHILAELGPRAKSAQPALRRFLPQEKDPFLRPRAIVALACVDPGNAEARAALKAALEDPEDEVRLRTVAALTDERERKLPPEFVGPLVPLLVRAMADANLDVRSRAAEALGKLGPEAKAAVPALVSALKDLNPDMRLAAIRALYHIDPRHEAVVP